jgi:gentisate 1,2-dioxygenase
MAGDKKIEWTQFDTVAIPGATWFQHVNTGKDPAILFVASDEPALKALAFYQKHGKNQNGDVVRLA